MNSSSLILSSSFSCSLTLFFFLFFFHLVTLPKLFQVDSYGYLNIYCKNIRNQNKVISINFCDTRTRSLFVFDSYLWILKELFQHITKHIFSAKHTKVRKMNRNHIHQRENYLFSFQVPDKHN